MRFFTRISVGALLACLAAQPSLAQSTASLPIPLAGPLAPDIASATEKPDPKLKYKIVFDVQSLPPSFDQIAPSFTSIGRIINSFRSYGVPADHMEITAVFHGRPIVLLTQDETFRNRTGVKANPNLELIKQLQAAGVRIVICGRSALAQNYTQADLASGVMTNLSATVTFLNLQTRGFVKLEI